MQKILGLPGSIPVLNAYGDDLSESLNSKMNTSTKSNTNLNDCQVSFLADSLNWGL